MVVRFDQTEPTRALRDPTITAEAALGGSGSGSAAPATTGGGP